MAGWCLSLKPLLSLHPALTRAWLLSANQVNQFQVNLYNLAKLTALFSFKLEMYTIRTC